MARSTLDTILGVLFIVIGILMVMGRLGIESVLPYLGVVLIVVGILMLLGKLPGGTLVGVVALAIGVLLAAGLLANTFPKPLREALGLVNLVLGIVLIVVGIRRLM